MAPPLYPLSIYVASLYPGAALYAPLVPMAHSLFFFYILKYSDWVSCWERIKEITPSSTYDAPPFNPLSVYGALFPEPPQYLWSAPPRTPLVHMALLLIPP